MAPWETEPALAAKSTLWADFADVWQTADKVVYSTTLDAVSTANTRLDLELLDDRQLSNGVVYLRYRIAI